MIQIHVEPGERLTKFAMLGNSQIGVVSKLMGRHENAPSISGFGLEHFEGEAQVHLGVTPNRFEGVEQNPSQ